MSDIIKEPCAHPILKLMSYFAIRGGVMDWNTWLDYNTYVGCVPLPLHMHHIATDDEATALLDSLGLEVFVDHENALSIRKIGLEPVVKELNWVDKLKVLSIIIGAIIFVMTYLYLGYKIVVHIGLLT